MTLRAPDEITHPGHLTTGSEAGALAALPSWLAPWHIAVVVALCLYVPWNAGRSLWFPDEPDVAEPAMTMVRTGDWVVPLQNDVPWLDYPPLTYWLGAASSQLAGEVTPFALRLPIALIAVSLVGFTAYSAQRVAGSRAGLWAGLTLATSPHFVYHAVNYHPDMPFATLVAAGIAIYAWGVVKRTGWRGWALRIAGFACFGGAILAKGPLGLLLPGLILVVWHASLRQWLAVLWMPVLSLASIAIAAPWYVLLIRATSWDYGWTEIYLQNFARFGTAVGRGHSQPWYYYLQVIWVDWAPWSLLLPATLIVAFKSGWRQRFVRLALISFLVTFVFLTAAATKREVYLLPVYPAIAFLFGWHLSMPSPSGAPRLRWFVAAVGGIFVLASIGLTSAMALDVPLEPKVLRLIGELAVPIGVISAGLGIGGLLLLRRLYDGLASPAIATVAAVLWLVYSVTLAAVMPGLDDERSYSVAAHWLREQSGAQPVGFYPSTPIENKRAGFRVEDPAFMPLEIVTSPTAAAELLSEPCRVLILHPDSASEMAEVVPDWKQISKHELVAGGKPYLVAGPCVDRAAR